MTGHFSGKTAWITGASSGIGAALAREAANRGTHVILSGRDEARLRDIADTCDTETLILPFDVRDEAAMHAATEKAIAWRGGIDLFVANAGISQRSRATQTAMQVYRDIIEIDLTAQIAAVQALLHNLVEQASKDEPKHLVFISSIAGKVGVPLRTAYCAAKHGLIGYADALRGELSQTGIGVHVVCPGSVATNVSRNALTASGTARGKSDKAIDDGLDPNTVATDILNAITLGQREIILAKGFEEAMGEMRRTPDQLFDQVAAMVANGYMDKVEAEG